MLPWTHFGLLLWILLLVLPTAKAFLSATRRTSWATTTTQQKTNLNLHALHTPIPTSSTRSTQSTTTTTPTTVPSASVAQVDGVSEECDSRDTTTTTTLISNKEDKDILSLCRVPIFPAKEPLSSFLSSSSSEAAGSEFEEFSILSWNILLPNHDSDNDNDNHNDSKNKSNNNWWNHKMYSSTVPMEARKWPHRHRLIRDRLLRSDADIICIQEAAGETLDRDFAFLKDAGYDHVCHKKFRFRCATFFKRDKFRLVQAAPNKDRTLVTALEVVMTQKKKESTTTTAATTTTKKRKALNQNGQPTQTQQHQPPPFLLHVVNCHLSGGAAPEQRLRQVHDGVDQIQKWKNQAMAALEKQQRANRPNPHKRQQAEQAVQQYEQRSGIIVCGDFNSDGNTGVRRYLVTGSVDPEWFEPQYPTLRLTSKRREHFFGMFLDAAELAYGSNVCDGDYGESPRTITNTCSTVSTALSSSLQQQQQQHYYNYGRPATYVVPNLASLLLLPVQGEKEARTEFGYQVAKGIVDTLGMRRFCDKEIDQAFDRIDLDGNGIIDEHEVQQLLESVYYETTYCRGQQHPQSATTTIMEEEKDDHKTKFMNGFRDLSAVADDNDDDDDDVVVAGTGGLSREQLKERLLTLQQQLEGGKEGVELVEIQTDLDAQRMIDRFTPVLRDALDYVFHKLLSSSNGGDGETLTKADVDEFLIKTNGRLGRGGMWRHTTALFERNAEASSADGSPSAPPTLSRHDWYSAFARELGEGKWWQVVYDLEVFGANLRGGGGGASNTITSKAANNTGQQHYQGWLDYLYFDSQHLTCKGIQDSLTPSELSLIYDKGDALPNEWHPSDHLPVAAIFAWPPSSS